MHIQRNSEAHLTNICGNVKATSITYPGCVFVDLVIQHSKRVILSSMACMSLTYFSTRSHKRHDFRENLCLFNFTLFEIFLILRRIQRDIIINKYRASCKVTVIDVRF